MRKVLINLTLAALLAVTSIGASFAQAEAAVREVVPAEARVAAQERAQVPAELPEPGDLLARAALTAAATSIQIALGKGLPEFRAPPTQGRLARTSKPEVAKYL